MDITGTLIRLVVHVPELGSFYLKPLAPLPALEVVIAARMAGVRIERLAESMNGTDDQDGAVRAINELTAVHCDDDRDEWCA